jgi:hypothetical protein
MEMSGQNDKNNLSDNIDSQTLQLRAVKKRMFLSRDLKVLELQLSTLSLHQQKP